MRCGRQLGSDVDPGDAESGRGLKAAGGEKGEEWTGEGQDHATIVRVTRAADFLTQGDGRTFRYRPAHEQLGRSLGTQLAMGFPTTPFCPSRTSAVQVPAPYQRRWMVWDGSYDYTRTAAGVYRDKGEGRRGSEGAEPSSPGSAWAWQAGRRSRATRGVFWPRRIASTIWTTRTRYLSRAAKHP